MSAALMSIGEAWQCIYCEGLYPADSMFSRNRNAPTGCCLECRREYRKKLYDRDPAGAKAYAADWKRRNRSKLPHYGRKFRHGITAAQFEALTVSQGGVCAICGQDGGPRGLRVDHCHEKGKGSIRALLCDLCNRGLGMFADSSARLEAAAAYLRRHGR